MSDKKSKNEVNIGEKGSYVDVGMFCEGDNCQLFLGPVGDLVMRHTATFSINKNDVVKLLVEIIAVTAKTLAKYLVEKQ
jgi:hypothetical protein